MKNLKQPLFALSALSLALTAGYAQAETEQLSTIEVNTNAVDTTITHKDHDKLVATDLKQLMKNEVGMSISGGNGVAQYYSIRGIGEDKITLDVDGTTNSTSILHHQGRFMIDPALIKVIDVEKGTGSASAGLGALAGVVRATTVDAKDLLRDGQNVGLKFGATASSNRGFSTNVAAYANQNGFDALFAGNFLQNDNYKDGNGNKLYGSKLDQNSYLAKLGYDFNENHQIRLSLRQEYQEGLRKPQIEFPYDNEAKADAASTGESQSAQRQRTINLEYHGKNLGFLSKIDFNVFREQIDDYKPPKDTSTSTTPNTNTSTEMEVTKAYSTGANLNLASKIGAHEIKYGVNYRTEKSQPSDKAWYTKGSSLALSEQKKHEYGVYTEGLWSFDPFLLTTGVRYDGFRYYDSTGKSVSDGQVNPSVGLIYSVTSDLSLIATYNQASRAPRLAEALLYGERYKGFTADENLKAETARRGEFGVKWQRGGFELSANVFSQTIKDVVMFSGNKNNPSLSTVTNDGKIKMKGYEVDTAYTNGGFKARLSVSDSNPKLDRTGSDPYAEDPYLFWRIGRQWLASLSYRFENPSLEIGWNGRFYEGVNYYAAKQTPKWQRKAGYAVHDLFVNWQPLHNDQFNVNLGVNNLFNKQYRSQSQRGNIGYYERGREFVIGFNYKF